MAGAEVILTDLPHITPLTQHNLKVNCGSQQQHSKVGYLLTVYTQPRGIHQVVLTVLTLSALLKDHAAR